MSILLLAVGLVLLALPGALAGLGGRLAPPEWCRAVLTCLRVGRFAVHAGLAYAAVPPLLALAGAHEAAHVCHRAVTGGLPLPPAVGWLAGLALATSVRRSVANRRRNRAALRRLRAEPWLGHHRFEDGVDVVTLSCPQQLAYAVPGRPDQVVVSDGFLAALDRAEAEAVLRHERAHLRHRHHHALALAGDVEARLGWFPPAARSVAVLRLAVERWADEEAAGDSGAGRPAVHRALLKTVALAVGPVPGFTEATTIAARLQALAATPPDPSLPARIVATGPMLALSALVVGALAACAAFAHGGIDELLGHCPF